MKHKIGICIPYRNRQEHLEKLIPHLSNHLRKQNIDFAFYVGHQVDDKLFNRGAMKNIAAQQAFDDGCDYIAWHDVDMLPHDDCDYSYPEKYPVHIATRLSKYRFGLNYDQYFGGIVLFSKRQVQKTNGYSNEYWDWGQEDDDLFWRCYFEKFTTGDTFRTYSSRTVAVFNGDNSMMTLPTNREISSCLNREFTISVLTYCEQQQDKVPIWLVGDRNKKFIEYPLIRKDGSHNWGISFNNSRAMTMKLFDRGGNLYYNWGKRFENLWTWVTLSYSMDSKNSYLFINGDLTRQMNGNKENKPFPIAQPLRIHDSVKPFILGFCPAMNTHFKGKIAEVKIFNKCITNVFNAIDGNDDLVLHYNFTEGLTDKINQQDANSSNITFEEETINLIDNILPYRREGTINCLPHVDEGFVAGGWAKGDTTARNEKRFVTEMQQRKIDYKEEGFNKILDLARIVSLDTTSYPNTTIINTMMK